MAGRVHGREGAKPSGSEEEQRRLLALYAAACCPYRNDTLINDVKDLDPSDFTVSTSSDELSFLREFASHGLLEFTKFFDSIDREQLEDRGAWTDSSEMVVALLCAVSYIKRLGQHCGNLQTILVNTLDQINADASTPLKQLETAVLAGERPVSQLAKSLDFTPHLKWATVETPLKNRVGFKETAAVISEGKVGQEKLKASDFQRRRQRNPTGYHKFTFKPGILGAEESDTESAETRSRVSRTSRGGSTDGGSTRGSAYGAPGGFTSRSASSGPEDTDYLDEDGERQPNPFQRGDKSASSVAFSFDKERQVIEDREADPQWEQQERHQRRYSRIRNRVPTGHPALMRGPSDELADIVHEYERTLTSLHLDQTTAVNTEANKAGGVGPLLEEVEKLPAPDAATLERPPPRFKEHQVAMVSGGEEEKPPADVKQTRRAGITFEDEENVSSPHAAKSAVRRPPGRRQRRTGGIVFEDVETGPGEKGG